MLSKLAQSEFNSFNVLKNRLRRSRCEYLNLQITYVLDLDSGPVIINASFSSQIMFCHTLKVDGG
jgi:hypothetical protein